MPHTNRKKKNPPQKPIHTKRQQVEDNDGWTHVIEGKKHASHAKAKSISKEPWLHGGDFMLNGVSYIDRTLEEMTADQEHYLKQWEASDACETLKTQLETVEGRVPVRNVVCLGLGSLQSSRREGRRASHTQLAALRTIMQQLDLPTPPQCHLQDPQFTTLDKEYLSSLGYTVVDDPAAYNHIVESSLVYAIHCYAEIYEKVGNGPRPALLVSTDVSNFEIYTPAEIKEPKGRLEAVVEGCEMLDFPQVRHDFSDTKLYWRKSANSAPVVAEVTPAQEESVSETATTSQVSTSENEVSTSEITIPEVPIPESTPAPENSVSEEVIASEVSHPEMAVSKEQDTPELTIPESTPSSETPASEPKFASEIEASEADVNTEHVMLEPPHASEMEIAEAISTSVIPTDGPMSVPDIKASEKVASQEAANSEPSPVTEESTPETGATTEVLKSEPVASPENATSEAEVATEVAVPEPPATSPQSPRQSRISCYPL